MHFSALRGINRTAWDIKQILMADPLFGLYQFMSCTEGTALLFEFEWFLYPTPSTPHLLPPPSHPTPAHPLPIDLIQDITGTEETI